MVVWDFFRLFVPTIRALANTSDTRVWNMGHALQEHARGKHPEHVFLLYREQRFTYFEANALVNRHAHAYRALGIASGDVVALLLDNRPEFLWHILALSKIGAVASLINTNNTGEPLLHSLRICAPKLVIVGSEHSDAFQQVRDRLEPGLQAITDRDPEHPDSSGAATFAENLAAASTDDPSEAGATQLHDLAAYIYTSGTTGMPKAARVRHKRLYIMGQLMRLFGWRLRQSDVIYNCLPLYHTSGLAVGTAAVICGGSTMALARRFSASRFWEDVRRFRATGFVYIGELCRYLIAQPLRPEDGDHTIAVIVGNGLRPDIWSAFQQRFRIGRISEFYGSTEGNVGTVNMGGTVGSVGFLFPRSVLVQWDEAAGDFLRDASGFLVKAKTDQPGVLLGRIKDPAKFDIYQDQQATQKKILRNVFVQGDAWFNTGDLLRADRWRRLYFVDRLGDSFRWKGENVSTFEVQEQLSSWPAARDVNVYGVQVPGTEGRAGMVALVAQDGFDPEAFKRHVDATLPAYARPLFVRVQTQIETTATFKLKKADLVAQGFDPHVVQDPLYVRDAETNAYVPLSAERFEALKTGRQRL